jgi:hypothetical protein
MCNPHVPQLTTDHSAQERGLHGKEEQHPLISYDGRLTFVQKHAAAAALIGFAPV